MPRFDFLPSYHYEVNTDGIINKPADKLLRKCTIYGAEGGVGDLNDNGKYVIPITVASNLVDVSKITGGRNSYRYTVNSAANNNVKVNNGIITISYARYAMGVAYYDTKMTLPAGTYTLSAECYLDMDDGAMGMGLGVRQVVSPDKNYLADKKFDAYKQWQTFSMSFTLTEDTEVAVLVQPTGTADNYYPIMNVKNIQLTAEADSKTTYIELDKPLGEGERIDISGIYVPNERNIITVDTAVQPSAVEYQYYTY